MNGKIFISLIIASLMVYIEGHGRMMEPTNRASVWRLRYLPDFKNIPEVNYENEWCGFDDPVKDARKNLRNATCGVCGPIYNNKPEAITQIWKSSSNKFVNVTSFERTSPVYTGKIVKTYIRGEWIEVQIKVNYCFNFKIVEFFIKK